MIKSYDKKNLLFIIKNITINHENLHCIIHSKIGFTQTETTCA
jgi:hypothetical protein